ncbi:hypothetical protein BT69DRAFT_325655 [Atractiella rhizophila]|nr:hypothetical protein BT69DRAFT_325655 [Atractiella rhizophila]
MPPKYQKRPTLPPSLRKELEDLGHIQPPKRKGKSVLGRRDKRKADREAGKEKKRISYEGKGDAGKGKRKREEDGNAQKKKKAKLEPSATSTSHAKTTGRSNQPPISSKRPKQTPLEKLVQKSEGRLAGSSAKSGSEKRNKKLPPRLPGGGSDEEDEEDRKIKWLEKQLGEVREEWEGDGLDVCSLSNANFVSPVSLVSNDERMSLLG